MPEPIEDLWPSLAPSLQDPEPVVFLKQQAKLIGEKTSNLVQGEVVSSLSSNDVYYTLYLNANNNVMKFDKYQFKILSVFHPITRASSEPFPLSAQDSFGGQVVLLSSMSEFKGWLRTVLSSPQVLAVLSNLQREQRGILDTVRSKGT